MKGDSNMSDSWRVEGSGLPVLAMDYFEVEVR